MKIRDLTEATVLQANDYVPVDNGTATRKFNLGDIINALTLPFGVQKTYGDFTVDGYISYAGKSLLFTIPMGVICDNPPQIYEMTIIVRGAAGYVVNETNVIHQGTAIAGWSLTSAALASEMLLNVRLSKTEAFDQTNNTPVSINIKGLVLVGQ